MNNQLFCFECMKQIESIDEKCSCGFDNKSYSPEPHYLLPSSILRDRYYVGKVIGEGGFGITYIGYDTVLNLKVAIKEFYMSGCVNRNTSYSSTISSQGDNEELFHRNKDKFLGEARVLAKFSSEPSIVGIRDFFEENNTAYIVMDYIEGETLKEYLKREGKINWRKTLEIFAPVLDSLKKVHEDNIIHRDISLDNIVLASDGKVVLLDFGAAREVSSDSDDKSLSVILKPGYAPEEQYRSKGKQGPWTDIYALCATMYVCITATLPDGSMDRLYEDTLRAPSQIEPSCDSRLDSVILKGMAVRAEDRYQSISELQKDIQVVLDGQAPSEDVSELPASNEEVISQPSNASDDYSRFSPDKNNIPDNKPEIVETIPSTSEEPVITSPVEGTPTQKAHLPKANILIPFLLVLGVVIIVATILIVKTLTNPNSTGGDPIDISQTNTFNDPIEGETSTEFPEALKSFSFTFGKDEYVLPMSYEDFKSRGWTLSFDQTVEDKKIDGNSYEYVQMENSDNKIYVYVINMSGDAKPFKDCKVGGIEVMACNLTNVNLFTISEDIKLNTPAKTVLKKIGNPTYNNEYDEYVSLTYNLDDNYYTSTCFTIYNDSDSIYNTISIRNFVADESDITETKTEAPDYLSDYKPETFTTSNELITQPYVTIDGQPYSLPCTIDCFLDNGWEIDEKPEYVEAGNAAYMMLKKGENKLEIAIKNFAEYQTLPENCAVTRVNVSSYLITDTSIFNFCGIEIGTKESDVQLMVKDAKDEWDFTENTYSNTYTYYSTYSDEKETSFYIRVDTETGKVADIHVEGKTWYY